LDPHARPAVARAAARPLVLPDADEVVTPVDREHEEGIAVVDPGRLEPPEERAKASSLAFSCWT
jgi:hypothetical protein